MALVKEPVTPSLIANTTMVKGILNGVLKQFEITPNENYVVHDNRLDLPIIDNDTMEVIGTQLGYAEGRISVRFDYDFDTIVQDTITDSNGNTITINKIGAYELYAIPRDSRPPDSYISGVDDEHEVM